MATTFVQEPVAACHSSEPLKEPSSTAQPVHTIGEALTHAETTFIFRHPVSKTLHEKALNFMPGGNTRSVLHSDPFPVCLKRGEGNKLWDHDGNQYIDFVGELTAGLYGHSHPKMRETILATFDHIGMNLGGTTKEETQLAELICQRFPHIQHLRFCNSGTEANVYALSIARHITGRSKVIAFGGGYHGGVLSFGHGVAKNNVDKDDWVLGRFNDAAAAKALIENTPNVAAVIVEAMQGAGGCVPATSKFLHTVQVAAKAAGQIFILDEVMTSRLHPSGLAGKLNLAPDLTTLGKYIGGGMAFGAFGGSKHLLSSFDPRIAGSLPHSGTFNNNTLSMSLGFVGLAEIYTPSANLALNSLGDYFRSELQAISQGTQMVVVGVGAVLTIHFLKNGATPSTAEDIDHNNVPELKRLFWFWCLEKGYWITERGMLSIILDTTRAEIDGYLAIVRDFVKDYANLIAL